jgi:hypothetical protein
MYILYTLTSSISTVGRALLPGTQTHEEGWRRYHERRPLLENNLSIPKIEGVNRYGWY